MRIVEAPERRYAELVDLALARCPELNPVELAPVLFEPGFADDVVALIAINGRHRRVLGAAVAWTGGGAPDDRMSVRVFVSREHEGQRVGSALHAAASTRLTRPVQVSMVFDGDERSLAVAGHWGYGVQQHLIRSELELHVLPCPPLPTGVTVEDCSSLELADAEAVAGMLAASQPETSTGQVIDFDRLRSWVPEDEVHLAALLRVDGRPVAIASGSLAGTHFYAAYTGVDPSHRRSGLAVVLKQQLHLMAADAGAKLAVTVNEGDDVAIRRVNDRLGYRPTTGEYRVRRLSVTNPLA